MEILLLAAFAAAAVLAVRQGNRLLTRKMDELKERSITLLEARLGHQLRYGSVSPSILGFLALRDLTVFSVQDPERPLLKINRVKIYYSIVRLLTTRDVLQSLSEIQIANSSLEVDRERDKELLEFFERLQAGPGDTAPLPRVRLSGANLSLRYRQTGWGAALQDLFTRNIYLSDRRIISALLYTLLQETGIILSRAIFRWRFFDFRVVTFVCFTINTGNVHFCLLFWKIVCLRNHQ